MSPVSPFGVVGAENDQSLGGCLFVKRAGATGSDLLASVVERGAVCLSGSLPSESGGGREPGSMSFPCGTISASRKLPFPGDFCGKGEECPRVTLRPAG